jgi:type IX secretion system PorP/SprF family membrane protein
MVYTSPKLHLGFSSPTLFQTRPFSENNAQQFLFHGKYTQAINEVAEILPSALIRIQKNSPVQADINTVFRFYELYSFGIGYRLNDAFIFTTAVKFSNQFEMGYAYDFTLSPIQSYSNGSHEIMLRYVFAYPVTAVRPRY